MLNRNWRHCSKRSFISARIDLSGGWSDTPPITYEQGGAVLNVAVKLNGQVGIFHFVTIKVTRAM